jgi:proteasome lid subunit RPN8/RPN11
MNPVLISEDAMGALLRHAGETYPEECCGFLFTPEREASTSGPRKIVRSARAPNRALGERRRRFVITPQELQDAEASARANGEAVTGFYHSHPDHPAAPSAFDTQHAWPWYTYLIVSVPESRVPTTIGAFELDPDSGEFRRVVWTVPSGIAPLPGGQAPG